MLYLKIINIDVLVIVKVDGIFLVFVPFLKIINIDCFCHCESCGRSCEQFLK